MSESPMQDETKSEITGLLEEIKGGKITPKEIEQVETELARVINTPWVAVDIQEDIESIDRAFTEITNKTKRK